MFDPQALVRALSGVRYVLIGGVAMRYHGSAFTSNDFDVAYDRMPQNRRRLVEALRQLHPKLRGTTDEIPFKFDERTIKNDLNCTFVTDCGDVDLLGSVAGFKNFQDVLRFAERRKLYGTDVDVLGLEGLIIAKRAAARTKDAAHLPELEALLEAQRQARTPGR